MRRYAFAAGVIEREFAPGLVGLDPLRAPSLRRYCLPDHFDFGTPLLKARLAAWGGIDIALWDLIGKAAGVPVYELLGGASARTRTLRALIPTLPAGCGRGRGSHGGARA